MAAWFFEKDKKAYLSASSDLKRDKRFELLNESFSNIRNFVKDNTINGVLLDLGISSTQLDDPKRGFSFQSDGPLDMRIDNSRGISAKDWINSASKKEIEDTLWLLGEERASRKIASKIVNHRQVNPIESTKVLSDIILSCVQRRTKKHPATKSFRAIRMFVNNELQELQQVLDASSYLFMLWWKASCNQLPFD